MFLLYPLYRYVDVINDIYIYFSVSVKDKQASQNSLRYSKEN